MGRGNRRRWLMATPHPCDLSLKGRGPARRGWRRSERDEARRLEGKAGEVAGAEGVLWGSEEGVGGNKGHEQVAGAVEGMVERMVVGEAGDFGPPEGAQAVE